MSNLNKINKGLWWIYTQTLLRRRFVCVGKKTIIFKPMRIDYPNSIKLGNQVFIAESAWLMGSSKESNVSLQIGDNTVIGNYSHIVATKDVCIGRYVLIADKVFITDCTHEYQNSEKPIMEQSVRFLNAVSIGDGAWIGENVCILGASIGKHSIIGANTVVITDIPDFCVAAGNPARIVKCFNEKTGTWEKVNNE